VARAWSICSTPGCGQATRGGRCDDCAHAADLARGTASQRGYSSAHRRFREAVLAADPICVQCQVRASTVADHYPVSRRDLEAIGENPNDPKHGRGLCKPCHDRATAANQPGGWAAQG
jgi:5-methylcytosine-specific restriction protein A